MYKRQQSNPYFETEFDVELSLSSFDLGFKQVIANTQDNKIIFLENGQVSVYNILGELLSQFSIPGGTQISYDRLNNHIIIIENIVTHYRYSMSGVLLETYNFPFLPITNFEGLGAILEITDDGTPLLRVPDVYPFPPDDYFIDRFIVFDYESESYSHTFTSYPEILNNYWAEDYSNMKLHENTIDFHVATTINTNTSLHMSFNRHDGTLISSENSSSGLSFFGADHESFIRLNDGNGPFQSVISGDCSRNSIEEIDSKTILNLKNGGWLFGNYYMDCESKVVQQLNTYYDRRILDTNVAYRYDDDENKLYVLRFGPDDDLDGFSASIDCDDQNAMINPGMIEIPRNGIDDDCDPSTVDDPLRDTESAQVFTIGNFGSAINPEVRNDISFENLTLYPNPFTNNINISNPIGEPLKIELYNTLGERIKSTIFENDNPINIITIDLHSGMYMIRIEDEKGNRKLVKMIKS